MKKIYITIIFVILCLVMIIITNLPIIGDYIDYQSNGSSMFIDNSNYSHSTYILEEEVSIEIDITNIEFYKNSTVYDGELYSIIISNALISDGNILLSLNIESHYDFNGGKIIKHKDASDNNILNYNLSIKTQFIDETIYYGSINGSGNTNNGVNIFIYTINNIEDDFNIYDYEYATILLSGFVVNEYVRK